MEQWKDIPWYEWYYQVSNIWNIRSLIYTNIHWEFSRIKNLKFNLKSNWYLTISLCRNYKKKHFYVHRLVAQLFKPNPNNLPEVNHLDGNKLNNNDWNLEWSTRLKNIRHSIEVLWNIWFTWVFGKDNHCSKKINQYDKQWNFIRTWDCMADVTRELWIYAQSVSWCCRWKLKTTWWYKWNYV